MGVKNWPSFKILGIKVDFPTLEQALSWAENQIKYNKVVQITTPNAEQVVLAQKDLEFKRILNNSALAICDGAGLLWAVKWLNQRLKKKGRKKQKLEEVENFAGLKQNLKRLTGTDLMLALCQKAAEKGWRVFLLGGKEGVAQEAAAQLKKQFIHSNFTPKTKEISFKRKKEKSSRPRGRLLDLEETGLDQKTFQKKPPAFLNIRFSAGTKDVNYESASQRQKIIQQINDFAPQLLFVAYGAPKQEKWLAANLVNLKVNIAMGVGGAFDYLAGRLPRAPRWWQNLALEWLWRLFCQPWRWQRQLALFKFVWLVFKASL